MNRKLFTSEESMENVMSSGAVECNLSTPIAGYTNEGVAVTASAPTISYNSKDTSPLEEEINMLKQVVEYKSLQVPAKMAAEVPALLKGIKDSIILKPGIKLTELRLYLNENGELVVQSRYFSNQHLISMNFLLEEASSGRTDLATMLNAKSNIVSFDNTKLMDAISKFIETCAQESVDTEQLIQAYLLRRRCHVIKQHIKYITNNSMPEDQLNKKYKALYNKDVEDLYNGEFRLLNTFQIEGKIFTIIRKYMHLLKGNFNADFEIKSSYEQDTVEVQVISGSDIYVIFYIDWKEAPEFPCLKSMLEKLIAKGIILSTEPVEALYLLGTPEVLWELKEIQAQGLSLMDAQKMLDLIGRKRRELHKKQRTLLSDYLKMQEEEDLVILNYHIRADTESVQPTQEDIPRENLGLCKIYIGIDCAPCTPRPGIYLPGALDVLGLDGATLGTKDAYSKLFGAWQWSFTEELNTAAIEQYEENLKKYFDALYEKGCIRGAEWEVKPISEESLPTKVKGF